MPAKGDKHAEDCLYLNVWTPEKPKKPLPVMVWFHGGDHLSGSAAEAHSGDDNARFDGSVLASKSVVVVTINYRLGPLGFLPLGDKQARSGPLFGNQGLWDQAFALQWVQENVEVFGGDPDNVTIFGQGSGAVDVCLHVASPQSGGKDLFHGAIGQSGGCTRYHHTAEEQREGLAEFLDKLGCKDDDADARLGCLRAKSAGELFDAIPDRKAGKKWFGPSVDGRFLPDQPRILFEDQRAAGVPYLLGSNANDASAVLDDMEPVDSEDAYHKALEKLFPDATEEERCEAYPHDAYAHMKKPYQTALAHVLADGAFACSVLHTAVHARTSGSAVYSHHFTGLDKDGDASADFGSDVGYVFGTNDVPESGSALRDAVQSYWTSFANEGFPGKHGDAPDWPQLGQKPRKVFRLGSEVEVLLDFRKLQCALWDGAYDAEFKAPRKPATPEEP
jgi:para-nitrobenzyl esterase